MLISNTSNNHFFSAGVIATTNSLINYETLFNAGTTSFACSVTCSDGEASDTASLTIDVTNVNEAPSFPQNAYTVSVDEGPVSLTKRFCKCLY